MDTSQILEVKVANSNVIKTLGVCREVPVWLQGHEFLVHLHVLQMEAVICVGYTLVRYPRGYSMGL